MNKDQVIKHGEVIKWFIDNSDKGVWSKLMTSKWHFLTDPSFDVNYEYIQNDEYAEFRKALADGKQLQIKDLFGKWLDYDKNPTGKFTYTVDKYRIKSDEPKFKVGDWVINYTTITRIKDERDITHFTNTKAEKWEPKHGELIYSKDSCGKITVEKYNGQHEVFPFIGEATWLQKKD